MNANLEGGLKSRGEVSGVESVCTHWIRWKGFGMNFSAVNSGTVGESSSAREPGAGDADVDLSGEFLEAGAHTKV